MKQIRHPLSNHHAPLVARIILNKGILALLIGVLIMAISWFIFFCSNQAKNWNVLLIVIDTLRSDHLGCYGYTLNTSSYIDRFAEESVLFEYAVAQSSWTAPSVASLFTSLYPYSHNVRKKNEALSLDVITLAEIMKENGYRTFGLVSNPVLKRKMQYYQGFDYYEFLTPRAGLYAERGALVVKNFFDILDRKSEERFFGYIHLMDPHLPYQPHPKYANRFIRSGYRGLFKKLHIPHSVRFKKTLRKLKPRDLERIIALYDAEINYSDDNFKKIISGIEKEANF